jgi:glycosyltransferase involved in cell wall biosynthesis
MVEVSGEPKGMDGAPRRLRIIHCFRSPVGGIFRHVRDLAEAQTAAGHEVGIVCDSSTGGDYEAKLFAEIERKLALGVRRTPMQRHIGLGDLGAAWRTFAIVKELRPDVLHGHGAKGGVYSRVFGSLFRVSGSRVARIYSPHGGSLHYDERTATGRLFFAVERAMARVSDQLLFVSEHELATFRRKIGEPPRRYAVVYNGLRPEEFEPVATAPDAADFVYIGMMRDLKGPDLFIDALGRTAASMGHKLRAVMVGDGADLPRYRAEASSTQDIDVTFMPAMRARDAFGLGRVMVVPSRAEAMPYIVLESLAAGRPMIATAVGGIPEIFGSHSPALASAEAGEISARMGAALADPARFAAAMPAPATLKERFSAATMAAAVEKAYRAALQPSG